MNNTAAKPSGGSAVMAQRVEAPGSLDDFPTPPFATRSLIECVLPLLDVSLASLNAWEPACNRGLMAMVLAEYSRRVYCSDVFDYGFRPGRPVGDALAPLGIDPPSVGSFVGRGLDVIATPGREGDQSNSRAPSRDGDVGIICTNPPFRLAGEFFERAIKDAPIVCLLLRTAWLESEERYLEIFRDRPPAIVAVFTERVCMTKGRWEPEGSTATSYAWFCWTRAPVMTTRLYWIPYGQKPRLSRRSDIDFARAVGALGENPQAEGAML